MAVSCPVGNNEFNELVELYGRAEALHIHYLKENNTFPDNLDVKDEVRVRDYLNNIYVNNNIEFYNDINTLVSKFDQSKQAYERMESTTPITDAQGETIAKLKEMALDEMKHYQAHLDTIFTMGRLRTDTVSVTNFLGKLLYKGDGHKEDTYKNFGIVLHEYIDKVLSEGVKSIANEQMFNEFYEKFIEKYPFEIEGLNKEDFYSIAKTVVTSIGVNEGHIMVPEISITGITHGTKLNPSKRIRGRIDLLTIDPKGEVTIVDFKAKKITTPLQEDADGNEILPDIYEELAVKIKPITGGRFNGKSITPMGEWSLQLRTYENILKEKGISVKNSKIITYAYHTDAKKKFKNGIVIPMDFDSMMSYAYEFVNDNGVPKQMIKRNQRALERMLFELDNMIRVEEKTEDAKAVEQTKIEPSRERMLKFVNTLESSLEGALTDARKERDNLKEGDIKQREILDKRINSLLSLSSIIKRYEGNPEIIHDSVNFNNAVTSIQIEIESITNRIKEIESELKRTSDDNVIKKNKLLGDAIKGFQFAQSYLSSVKAMKDILDDVAVNPQSQENFDNLNSIVNEMRNNIHVIESSFVASALEGVYLNIAHGIGVDKIQKAHSEVVQVLEPKLKRLEKQLENLENNKDNPGFVKQAKRIILFNLSPKSKKEYLEKFSETERGYLLEKEKLEKAIEETKAAIRGIDDYKDIETIKSFLFNIDDPSAINHGAKENFGSDHVFGKFYTGTYQAGSVSPNLIIASATTFLKHKHSEAFREAVNDPYMQKISKLVQDYIKRNENDVSSIDKLNDMLMEWGETYSYDRNNNSMTTGENYYMARIFSPEYVKNYKQGEIKVRIARKKYENALKEYYDLRRDVGKEDSTSLKQKRDEARNEWLSERRNYRQWQIENVNLPFIDEFYSLETTIPQKYAEEIETIMSQIEDMQFEIYDDNILDDAELDVLNGLLARKKEIQEKARQENPEYANAIDRYMELFEFETNDDFFNRKKMQMESMLTPEQYQKWLDQNQVTRPKKEFWNKLEQLRNQRATYFSANAVLDELFKRKNNLLKPYKVKGEIVPKLISDEVFAELNEIESAITAEMESKSNDLLTPEEWGAYAQIKNEIESLVDKQLSKHYQKEAEDRYEVLRLKFEAFDDASIYADANTTNEAEVRLNLAYSQFIAEEKKFKEWFNNIHENKYRSISENNDVFHNAKPRDFNFSTVSKNESLMETVPHSRNFSVRRVRKDYWIRNGETLTQKQIQRIKLEESYKELIASGEIKVRQGARNLNHIEAIDGILLPKGIVENPDGSFSYEGANLSNINKKYVDIKNNKELSEIYNSLFQLALESNDRMDNKRSYLVPGLQSTGIEDIVRGGVKSVFEKGFNKFKDDTISVESKADLLSNEFGEAGDAVHKVMNPEHQLPRGMQTENGIEAFLQYGAESHIAKEMRGAQNISKSLTELLKVQRKNIESEYTGTTAKDVEMRNRLNRLNNMIDQIEYEQRKLISNQYDRTESKLVKKRLNLLFQYISVMRIGFDIANQMKNFTAGTLQQFIAAGHSGDHYGRKDWREAYKIFTSEFMPQYFKDYGKLHDLGKYTMMYRIFNPMQKETSYFARDVAGGRKRKAITGATDIMNLGYLTQDRGDTTIGTITMLSVLNHYEFDTFDIDADGNKVYRIDEKTGERIKIKAHQAYYVNQDGQMDIRPDVEYSWDEHFYLRKVIISEMRRSQGNYAKADQTKAEETILGRAMFFFRKYLVPLMMNRFGTLKPQYETGEAAYGYWRALWDANKNFGFQASMKEFLLGSKLLEFTGYQGLPGVAVKDNKSKFKVGNLYQRKIAQARRDAVAMIMLAISSTMALAFLKQKQEDDEEVGVITGNMIRILWGTRGEALAMFPIGPGGDEYIRNFTTAIPFQREFIKTKGMFGHLWYYTLAQIMEGGAEYNPHLHSETYENVYKKAFYQGKSMPFVKGDAKIRKDLIDLTGLKNIRDIFQPENRLEQMKQWI